MSYDAWGNRRDPATWVNYTTPPTDLITDRGFTGHEHVDAFGLINMNGRMYDPKTGRFLSADPFVQAPDQTQSFNRYSYCLNNPLTFTDPSGYQWLQIETPAMSPFAYHLLGYSSGGGNTRGWEVGSSASGIFPKMGVAGGAANSLEYDIALATNLDAIEGGTSHMSALRNQVSRGAYSGSGAETYDGDAAKVVFSYLTGGEVVAQRVSMVTSGAAAGGYVSDPKGNYAKYTVMSGNSFITMVGGWGLFGTEGIVLPERDFRLQSPNGVSVLEEGLHKTVIRLDHQATLDFYDYLDNRKKTGDFIVAVMPVPAGKASKITEKVLKTVAAFDFFFGGQPGYDKYTRLGNEQGITLTKYTSFNANGSCATFQIIMNFNKIVIGYKSVLE